MKTIWITFAPDETQINLIWQLIQSHTFQVSHFEEDEQHIIIPYAAMPNQLQKAYKHHLEQTTVVENAQALNDQAKSKPIKLLKAYTTITISEQQELF